MSWTPSTNISSASVASNTSTATNLPSAKIRSSLAQLDGSSNPATTIRVIPGPQLQAQAVVSSGVANTGFLKSSTISGSFSGSITNSIANVGLQSIASNNTIRVFDGATIAPVIHHSAAAAAVAAAQNNAVVSTGSSLHHSTVSAQHLIPASTMHISSTANVVTSKSTNQPNTVASNRSVAVIHNDTKPTLHSLGGNYHVTNIMQTQNNIGQSVATPPTNTVVQPTNVTAAVSVPNPQRLKVEDALSYLDKVKFKFNNQPQVYNEFLDIMKEFKSQSIDTPGVIQRVSNLFKGHPELIVGFNTFLPPGYKIEMQANDQVNVSMPNMNSPAIIISAPPSAGLSAQPGVTHPTSTLNAQINSQVHSANVSSQSVASVHPPPSVQPSVSGGPPPAAHLSSTNVPAATLTKPPPGIYNASIHSGLTAAANAANLRSGSIEHPIAAQISNATIAHHQLAAAANIAPTHHAPPPLAAHHHHQAAALHGSIGAHVSSAHVAAHPAPPGSHHAPALAGSSQPVEFNHAINYVNKIKNRFQGQPEVYKQFLEILHAYQKEQKIIKEGKQPDSKPLTESEVYSKVAKLFQNQEDLLQEFGQFLPESNNAAMVASGSNIFAGQAVHHYSLAAITPGASGSNAIPVNAPERNSLGPVGAIVSSSHHLGESSRLEHSAIVKRPIIRGSQMPSSQHSSHSTNGPALLNNNTSGQPLPGSLKRQAGGSLSNVSSAVPPFGHIHPPSKKPKMTCLRDVTLADAGKYASLNEYAFFDKVRKVLKSAEVYDNFLRILVLYNNEILSRSELLNLASGFLGKHPELLRWFKDFIGLKNNISNEVGSPASSSVTAVQSNVLYEPLPSRVVAIRDRERINSDVAMEVDYASCKRYGASYRALPKNFPQPKCSGRTALCKEVLNDTWVSFPSWSEDSTFVTSRKTQYEEYIYRCEDERFELDVVIETNLSAIRIFESLQKKMNRMSPEERAKFRLDDTLGGNSVILIQRAVRRIYGDKAPEIIEGLKKNPAVCVPLVLRRLKSKEEEWREAQKQFNKIWREQNEKYYLKSLDHQGNSFKQNDIKYLRSKSLINEIESIFEERHEQNDENADVPGAQPTTGPHIQFTYTDKDMIEHACNLIIHHVKRQTGIHKEDKQKIKQLLRQFVPDLFSTARGALSDDEEEEQDEDEEEVKAASPEQADDSERSSRMARFVFNSKETNKNANSNGSLSSNSQTNGGIRPQQLQNELEDDCYALFVVNQAWYLFFRLHQILCERLGKLATRAKIICDEHAAEKAIFASSNNSAACGDGPLRDDSPACLLRLKPRCEYTLDAYFTGVVDMVKQLLDGNLDSNQYEDQLREMFGIHAYVAFTMDKVVQNLVRQLQHIVSDEHCILSKQLYLDAKRQQCAGGACSTAVLRATGEHAYQKRAEQLLGDENVYKVIIYQREGKLSIELLDTECGDSDEEGTNGINNGGTLSTNCTVRWTDYVERYVKDQVNISSPLKQRLMQKPLFLVRSVAQLQSQSSADSMQDLNLDPTTASPVENKSSPDSPSHELDSVDKKPLQLVENTKCRFNVNSYKAVFVTDTGSYLYKRKSLLKARQSHPAVSKRLHGKFDKFHQKWIKKNCTKEQVGRCDNWLSGRIYETDSPTVSEPSGEKKQKQ